MERNFDEKREFIRMKVDTPVLITLLDGSNTVVKGKCKDLSGAGMLLDAEAALEIGVSVSMAISSGRSPFEATGEVARCTPNADGSFKLGLKVNEILD